MYSRYIVALLVSFILLGCSTVKDPYAHIADAQAQSILKKSIKAYGGLSKWNSKQYLSFKKWYALYDATGAEEVSVNQVHHYTPSKIYMTWQDDGDKIEQIHTEGVFKKLKNGKLEGDVNATQVKNSILAATFVMNVPFNLLDETATITYEGEVDFNDSKVHVLRVEYFPEKHDHHTTKDIWWHYFDTQSFLSTGYKVKHLDHISQVSNDSFIKKGGLVLPGKRSSYRLKLNGEREYLRAAYEYNDYKVTYDDIGQLD